MNTLKATTHVVLAFSCPFSIQYKSFTEPTNLSRLKADVQAYHDSGAYQTELNQVIATARQYIDQRITTNKTSNKPEKLAIVLDIDETSLSNYDSMLARDFAGDYKKIHNETMAANAPVIKSMLELYQDAQQHHAAVFFVTGRLPSEKQATESREWGIEFVTRIKITVDFAFYESWPLNIFKENFLYGKNFFMIFLVLV